LTTKNVSIIAEAMEEAMEETVQMRLLEVAKADPAARLPASERIYRVLRTAVRDLVLRPNEQLVDTEISEVFSVSKTPAREAFARLHAEGLIEIRPKQGTYVRPIVLDEIIEAMKIREALEVVVATSAARRISTEQKVRLEENLRRQFLAVAADAPIEFHGLDEAFHDLIAEASGYRRVPVLLDSTRLQIGRVRRLSAPIPGRIALLVQQHKKIADCVIAGDSPGSAQAMQAHMQDVYPFIERIYAEHPDAFGPSPRGTTTTS
jgi:DNA-binding GntR family transcriptional regulator